jgi:hypothetical protein
MTEAGLRRRQRPGRLASAGALHPGVAEEAGARVFTFPCSTGCFTASLARVRRLWLPHWSARTGSLSCMRR